MAKPKVISVKEAADLIPDGATIATAAFGLAGWPEEIALAMEEKFLKTGSPGNLTHSRSGNWRLEEQRRMPLAHDGMLTKFIGSHAGSSPKLLKQISDNKILAWNFPLGTILQVFREMGRRAPGLLTKTGLAHLSIRAMMAEN